MSRKSEDYYSKFLHDLLSGRDFNKSINQIFAALEDPEARKVFINCNIFGVLRDENLKKIIEKSDQNKADVAVVKVMLCRERPMARFIAFQIEEMREASDFVLRHVFPQHDGSGVYPQLADLDSVFPEHPKATLELLGYNLLILNELGQGEAQVLKVLDKQNIIPRLLFIIEKAPEFIKVGKDDLKKISQNLLNLLLSHIEIAKRVCTRLDLFGWLLRIAKTDLYNSKDTEMIQAISCLSFADEFLSKTKEELIVSKWVYESLCMILVPESRNEEFNLVNKGVNEEGFMKYLSFLAQILGNVSRSHGGIEEIMSSIKALRVDVIWRTHLALVKHAVRDFMVWYTVLYLTNSILRFPDYKPPLYALDNVSDILLTLACRAFRYLEFFTEHKANLCQVAVARYSLLSIKSFNHSISLPPIPSAQDLDDSETIERNVPRITAEWNQYAKSKQRPWDTIYSHPSTPENIQEPIQRYVFHMFQKFKQFKLFFKKLPKPCEFCKDYFNSAFIPDNVFWDFYSKEQPFHSFHLDGEEQKAMVEVSQHLPIVLIQFISVLCDDENLSFIMENVGSRLNELLLVGEGSLEEQVKCAIVTLYLTWAETKKNFQVFYLASGFLQFHQFYNSITLQVLQGQTLPFNLCRWDPIAKTFRIDSGKASPAGRDVNLWRIHMIFHLLELLRTVLRVSSTSIRNSIKAQCVGLVNMNYMLVSKLYELMNSDPKSRDIINAVIATTEEVSYVLIRLVPGLFYMIADTVFNNDYLFKIYIDMTGFLPSTISLYAHISSLYLFISKDKTKKMSFKVMSDHLEAFSHSILKVFNNICTIIEELEAANRRKPVDVDSQISETIEKILLLKCTYLLLLSLLHIFENDPNSVEHIPALSYMKMYERLQIVTAFAEKHFKHRSIDDRSFHFPNDFKNKDLRSVPGSRLYIVVDFEDENEDKLFRSYMTALLTWLWSLSQTENICVEIIVNPFTREVFRICFEYDYWSITSYMAICSMIYNFTIMRTHTVLHCHPLAIPLIVKLISEMNIPVEGYLLLFQSVREIYPKIMTPAEIQQVHSIIAPLRTLLSTSNPVLKYFNYPLLKQVRSQDNPNKMVLEDETQMAEVFPKQLLNVLPIEFGRNKNELGMPVFEEYPGQLLLQSEAKSIIKMITPVTQEGVATTRNKIKIHVKAGQGHLLYYKPNNHSREERFSSMLGRAGSRMINSQMSVVDPELVANEAFSSKVNDLYEKVLSDIFDKEHQVRY